MSRSNHDKPFYVDVGTSIVAIRCASNHDVLMRYDYSLSPNALNFAKGICDRMNREVELSCRMEGREMSNETNETISDIVADIRAQNQGLPDEFGAVVRITDKDFLKGETECPLYGKAIEEKKNHHWCADCNIGTDGTAVCLFRKCEREVKDGGPQGSL